MAQWFRSFAAESVGTVANATESLAATASTTWEVVAPATHGRGGSDNMLAVQKTDYGNDYAGLLFDNAPQSATMEVLIEGYVGEWFSNPSGVCPMVRGSSTAGYAASLLAAGDFYLVRLASSAYAGDSVGSASGLTLNGTTLYRIRINVSGSTISMKFWPAASAEPGSWQHTWSDSNLSASGYAGLMTRDSSGQVSHITFIGVGTDGDPAPDSAASAATLSSPTSASVTQTGATIGATTDNATGTLYGVVTTSASAPSATQIKAGQDHTGSAAAGSGSNASLSVGANTIAITGLTASTTYYYYLVQDNGADSNVVNGTFTTAVAAPTLTSPTAVSIGTTTVTPRVTTDTGNGTCYYVITPQAEGEPSNTQVEAGQNAAGGAPVASGSQVVSASGVITFSEVTGLTAGTAYRISYAHSGTPS